MKALNLISVFLLLVFAQSLIAEEIVLQNGLNGYNGCDDGSILDDGSGNEGNADSLIVEFEAC